MKMDLNAITIEQLGLSVRSTNALHRKNIQTAGQMMELSEEELFAIRNLGQKSVSEILQKIEELRSGAFSFHSLEQKEINDAETEDPAITDDRILKMLQEKRPGIEELNMLSAQAYNLLRFSGHETLEQILFLREEDLMRIPDMTAAAAREIEANCRIYLADLRKSIQDERTSDQTTQDDEQSILDKVHMSQYQDIILENARKNDIELKKLQLSNRSLNRLTTCGYRMMSDLIFMTPETLGEIRSLGAKSVQEIWSTIQNYLKDNEPRLLGTELTEGPREIDENALRLQILSLYRDKPFIGYSLKEMTEALALPASAEEKQIKHVIGSLLANGKLEYVDFRCYRLYKSFEEELEACDAIDERNRDILRRRLEGETLEAIAKEYGLTRERVRQLVKKTVQKISQWHVRTTQDQVFDEDYYRYFFQTYAIEKRDAADWLGIPDSVFRYLEMMDVKNGERELQEAPEDVQGLDAGLRLKIKNYLNRNRLFIDGVWVEKKRAELERFVIRKLCRELTSFDDFVIKYNDFLKAQEVEEPDLYLTEAVYQTRLNRITEARFVLWNWGEKFRYYDIDGRDYQELYDTLELNSFENIELSTLKLFREYPEVMREYDIRDQYELHNLLRKTVPDGSFHDFRCGRMPNIEFGRFDRDSAMLELIIENAHIRVSDLCDIINDIYGFAPRVTQGTYLAPFSEYMHQAVYSVDQKAMTAERRDKLHAALPDDFYYLDEIRKIYLNLFPDADPDEINAYNLKLMGFTVLARYAIQNHPSLEAYYKDLLNRDDFVNVAQYKKRFANASMFYSTLWDLRQNLELIEFEPEQFIHIRHLEASGISKDSLREFCDEVWNFAEAGEYFSFRSLRMRGFNAELLNLGFEDLFYASILQSDDRFSSGRVYGVTVFRKGQTNITIRSFIESMIREQRSMDMLDLLTKLKEEYGCNVENRSDILWKIAESDLYYDDTLDRLYVSDEEFYREFDETEESR